VELGYLTHQGQLVVADTLGRRTLFRAYRVDPAHPALEFLTLKRPLENLGRVRATVDFYPQGWGKPGKVVLRQTEANLYRGRTSHTLVGPTWKSLACFRLLTADPVKPPTLTSSILATPSLIGTSYPPRGASSVLFIEDASVMACRRTNNIVELFATEQVEFTDFALSKLKATVEFPAVGAAEEFSSHFPKIADPAMLDPAVVLDIGRNASILWPKTPLKGRVGLAIASVMIGLAAIAVPLAIRSVESLVVGGVLGTLLAIGIGITFVEYRNAYSAEILEFKNKWPRVTFERWTSDAPGHAAGFAFVMHEMGVNLDPEGGDLGPLDSYLRGLPADTFFAALAWDAAAYVGSILLREIGRPIPHEWRCDRTTGLPELHFTTIDLFVSPVYEVRAIWEKKEPTTLDTLVRTWARDVQVASAFQNLTEFTALGFLDHGREDIQEFSQRVLEELTPVPGESRILGENHYRVRRLLYPPFDIEVIEVELQKHSGPEFVPAIVVPFCQPTQIARARLEGGSPKSPEREDLAILRLEGYELVALGVQIRNYLEVGPGFAGRAKPFPIHLLAVADELEVASPRLRNVRADAKEFIAPLALSHEGVPMSPYVSLLGRITSVGEVVNPFRGLSLWRIGLDIAGFPLEVLIRKDRCRGLPERGYFVAGRVWLVANLESEEPEHAAYIR